MRRIFLDIGAHDGRTTRSVLAFPYRFDHVFCFEPQPFLCQQIRQIADPRVTACEFGLGATTGPVTLYRGGRLDSASLYATKRFHGPVRTEPVHLVRASEWFAWHLLEDDFVVARMNCEGAEVDILEDLFASGEIRKLHGLAVVFDIQKVAGQEHRETAIRAQLPRIPRVFVLTDRDARRLGADYLATWMRVILEEGPCDSSPSSPDPGST